MILAIAFALFLAAVLCIAYVLGVTATVTEADIDAFDRGYKAALADKPNLAAGVRETFGESSDRNKNARHRVGVKIATTILVLIWIIGVVAWVLLH